MLLTEGGSGVNENVTFCSLKAKQSLARASGIAARNVTRQSELPIQFPEGLLLVSSEPISEVISHSSRVIRESLEDTWVRPML